MQKDTFHQMVRSYFMGGLAFSYILPLIHFDFLPPSQNNILYLWQSVQYQYVEAPQANVHEWQSYSLADILTIALLAGIVVMSIRFIIQCVNLRRLPVYQRCSYKTCTILNVNAPIKPFSFAKWIYINPQLHTAEEANEIIRHEQIHVNQYHSVDIIVAAINRIVFWWNPLVIILNRDIRNNLEYIVDSEMLQNGISRKNYQFNILNISQMAYTNGIANYFNLYNLKKRIKMMNKEKSQPVHKMKWLLLLPVATLVLLSFNMKRATATNIDFAASSETIEPQSASAIEADTLVKKNAEETVKLMINVRDSIKMATPLIIIDGKEIDSKELTEINPDDIHSINVLKDESATKLYGEKGKGGVVIVETKGYKSDGASNFQGLFLRTSSKEDVLVIIDGKETDVDIKDLNQETIHSVTVLKNDSLIKPYGEKGKNGVIIIETKKSEE